MSNVDSEDAPNLASWKSSPLLNGNKRRRMQANCPRDLSKFTR